MGLLKRLFRRASTEPKKSLGMLRVLGRLDNEKSRLRVEVIEGVVYPGYKVSRRGKVPIRRLLMRDGDVDFAVEGDIVDVVLEGDLDAEPGDTLEVYLV